MHDLIQIGIAKIPFGRQCIVEAFRFVVQLFQEHWYA